VSCGGGTLAVPLADTVKFNDNIIRADINYIRMVVTTR
jgi:hypothetical protein